MTTVGGVIQRRPPVGGVRERHVRPELEQHTNDVGMASPGRAAQRGHPSPVESIGQSRILRQDPPDTVRITKPRRVDEVR